VKIVMPMAGHGRRLARLGDPKPKPLIKIHGRPMVLWALESLSAFSTSPVIFVVREQHEQEFGVSGILREALGLRARIVIQDGDRPGQLSSVLEARDLIDGDEDLLVGCADTWIDSDLGADIHSRLPDSRGLISLFDAEGDRWSFARLDEAGRVAEVAEKRRLAPPAFASTGFYYFANGREFIEAADSVIRSGRRTNGEFYVMPVYAEYLRRDWRVDISRAREVWDMGTPEGLERFLLREGIARAKMS
jgi:dTDP-glucose pyrophosphorylase